MDTTSPDALIRALGEVARARLMAGEEVEVPGIGVLRVEHVPSQRAERADGTHTLSPPRDIIEFEPGS